MFRGSGTGGSVGTLPSNYAGHRGSSNYFDGMHRASRDVSELTLVTDSKSSVNVLNDDIIHGNI